MKAWMHLLAPHFLYWVCLCAVLSRLIWSGGPCLTLDSSWGHAAPRCLLTRSLFALVGHRNSPQLPTASLPGTTRFIFILYKLNLCFILIDTFHDWGEPDCIQGLQQEQICVLIACRREAHDRCVGCKTVPLQVMWKRRKQTSEGIS